MGLEVALLSTVPWWVFAIIVTTPIGIFSGSELPFYLASLDKKSEKILFFNYLGTLLASFLFIGLAFKSKHTISLSVFMALSNLLICSYFGLSPKLKNMSYLIVGLLSLSHLKTIDFQNDARKASYLGFKLDSYQDAVNLFYAVKSSPNIYHQETPYQQIDFVPKDFYSIEKNTNDWALYLNRRVQIYSDSEKLYHQTMFFLSLLHLPNKPLKILILGGGDLGLIREANRILTQKSEIDLVELDPAMIDLAEQGPFLNKIHPTEYKYNFFQQDAFSFLLTNQKKYDLILADFPFPTNYDLMKLYSVEFYKLVNKSLLDDGVFIFDYPFFTHNSQEHKEGQKIILKTLSSAGLNFQVWGKFETFVLATKSKKFHRKSIFEYQEYLANDVVSNFINRTDHFSYDLKQVRINSIFKPVRSFTIDK